MSIEVRHMVVKSSVVQREGISGDDRWGEGRRDEERTREILHECRKMIRGSLDDRKER